MSPALGMSSSLWKRAAPGLLFAALALAVWADPLFTGRNFTGRDLLPYNLPTEKLIHDAYASGSLPIWNPYISGGRPLLANPNAGALYPVHMILSVLSFPAAVRIYPVVHWIAAGIGMLVLLRSLGVSRAGAFVGAATCVFSGASVSEVFYPHIQPGFALFPWILWAMHRRVRLGRVATPLLGAFFGLDFLAGDVFTGGLAIAAVLVWILLESPPGERRPALITLAIAVGLGALLAAPQIVATALWIPETNRAVLGMKLGEATLFSVSPLRLLELVVPYPFGPTWSLQPSLIWDTRVFNGKSIGLFSTLFAGALAPLAFWRLRRSREAGLRFARWFAAGGGLIAVLPSLLPASWATWSSPLPLRNPEKVIVVVAVCLAIIAARGFDEFRARPLRISLGLGGGAILTAAALAAFLLAPQVGAWAASRLAGDPGRARIAAEAIPSALAVAGLLWMATVLALEGARTARRGVAGLALLLLVLVPISATLPIIETSHPAAAFAPTRFALDVRHADPRGRFRVLGELIYEIDAAKRPATDLFILEHPRRDWVAHTQALWKIGTVFNGDFDAGDFARVESLRRVSGFAAPYVESTPFFGNLALKWGIRFSVDTPVSGYRPFAKRGNQDCDAIDTAFPALRLATRWQERTGALEALAATSKVREGELLLETGRQAEGTARPGTIRVLSETPSRLSLECRAPDPTWLFALRGFWRHRRVEVDGVEAEVVPAYLAFSAVMIPAGVHRVEWRELVPGFGVSMWGPPLFVLGVLWFAIRRRGTGAMAPGSPGSSQEAS